MNDIIIKFFNKILHEHKFETIDIPASNEKGEIWIQKCDCGQKQKVLFDGKGRCRSVNKI